MRTFKIEMYVLDPDMDPDTHVMWHLASISHEHWYDMLKEDIWRYFERTFS